MFSQRPDAGYAKSLSVYALSDTPENPWGHQTEHIKVSEHHSLPGHSEIVHSSVFATVFGQSLRESPQ
jgi:hypothetical protein